MQPLSGLGSLRRASMLLAGLALVGSAPGPADASVVFRLTASDVVVDQPAPLFTSDTVSGTLTLADIVTPGASFASTDVTGVTLDFGGIMGTLADVQAEIAPGPVQIFGTRSLDGNSLSVLDFRFGFPTSTPGCSFVCAGQIIINSPIGPNDPSNFIALDDLAGNTLSVISSFTPHISLVTGAVPEPASWMMMIAGVSLIGFGLRRRRSGVATGVAEIRGGGR